MACLTGLAHASHLKGGSVTWKRDTTVTTSFVAKAEVIINFDLSAASGLLDPIEPDSTHIPTVNNHPFYKVGDIVGSSVTLDWGEGPTVSLTEFKVVAVDPAAQIVSAKAVEYDPDGDADNDGIPDTEDIVPKHVYGWPTGVTSRDITVSASARDDSEELVNRTNTLMRIRSRVTKAEGNTPPAFNPADATLFVVPQGLPAEPKVTFEVPKAFDPEAAMTVPEEERDTVKYSFIEHESDASDMDTENDKSWEELQGMTITEDGHITWDTSNISQTIKTFSVQVVAKDYAPGSTTPKSSTTVELQLWVNDTTQEGKPEIEVFPASEKIYFREGEKGSFKVIGFDHGENSRLVLHHTPAELPLGARLLPTAGFAGAGEDNEGDHLTCTFDWTPTEAQAGQEYKMSFQFEDDDELLSKVVEVTVKVLGETEDPPPAEPLVLTVSQTSFTDVPQGTTITFTATGTCAATPGVPLAINSHSEIPEGATFTPQLPARADSDVGVGVETTFSWHTDSHDATLPDEPIEIELVLSDAYGRTQTQTVSITLQDPPPAPLITLAAGTTTPVTGTMWNSLLVNFDATGGSRQHPGLNFQALDGGELVRTEMDSPASNLLFWRLTPGQVQAGSGTLHVKVTDEWGANAVLSVPYVVSNPSAPAWWGPGAVLTGGAAVDFSMANQGQLKAIVTSAFTKLKVEYPDAETSTEEGIALAAYVNGLEAGTNNYEPLRQGQLKHAASLFYQAIGKLRGKEDMGLPWPEGTDDVNNYAAVTVGQVKMIFSFPQPLGGVVFNEPPTSVVITSPKNGATIIGEQDIEVKASATDPDEVIDRVDFYEGGVLFGTDSSAPYSAVFPAAALGEHVFKAKVVDNQGLSLTSRPVTVTVVPDAPDLVEIKSPAADSHFPAGQTVPIEVKVNDPDNNLVQMELYEGTTLIGTYGASASGTYTLSWLQATPGTYDLSVRVIDAEAQELTSAPVELVRDFNPGPDVVVYRPAQNDRTPAYKKTGANTSIPTGTIEIDAMVTDVHGVQSVRFYGGPAGGSLTLLEEDYGAPFACSWSGLSAGSYEVRLVATDIYGATTTIDRDVTVVAPTTVVLQQGLNRVTLLPDATNGYTGMADTYIRSSVPNMTAGSDPTLLFDEGHPASYGLMYWPLVPGLTGIPSTATVLDAKITFDVISAGTCHCQVLPVKKDWDETAATWNTTGLAYAWDTPGAKGSGDAGGYGLAYMAHGSAGTREMGFEDVRPLQAWIGGTPVIDGINYGTNQGFKIDVWGETVKDEDPFVVSSSEATDVTKRPKLTITYYQD
ncbi:Ig-like domain-containing protein [Luteolibacter soli]